ncbi:hypothetical protein Bca52824_007795 [Brassica carinata]|uniref:Reverse transcriptase zinc-binding domain-containing protein n=1 Tax=Brassica carinata TaxID=52824 RepID=A0A8X7W8T3_BRACI|nr:hypothetical protein Bca52824_007795 [Brassica carinata]
MLFFKKESVWVAWIHQNVIKDKNFWELKEHQSHTWLFKKLLRLRDKATEWLRVLPGNGSSCSFWLTPWSPYGQLLSYFGSGRRRQSGIPLNATLASLWNGDAWSISPARSPQMEQVQIHLSTVILPDSPDVPEWNSNGITSNSIFNNNFVPCKIYDSLRVRKEPVSWSKIVWLQKGIPKHKTFTWMLVLNRCPTRDRLLSWGLAVDPGCLLCNNHPESRDHLFYGCSFTRSIWRPLAAKLYLNLHTDDWDQTLQVLITLSGDKHLRYLSLLSWQALLYEIWRERNQRLHQRRFRTSDSISDVISSLIKNKISSLRDLNPVESSVCMQIWLSLR